MPSHKQKKDKKKSHKHKHKNRSRSPLRRRNIQKKNEGKKENIPHNTSNWDADLKELNTYMDNRREMIKQVFSCVGEDFFAKSVPSILQQATREELKSICLEELNRMSSDVVFKVLEGIPCDTEPISSSEEGSKKDKRECLPSKLCGGHTSKSCSVEKCWTALKETKEKELASNKGDGEMSCEEKISELLETSRSETSQSDCEQNDHKSSEDETINLRSELPSTSNQPVMTKKLAKVAPFCISFPEPKICQPDSSVEVQEFESSELDDETSYETVDLEEEIGDGETESDSFVEEPIGDSSPNVCALGENSDYQEVVEEEVQQNLSEMIELEHRARAIKSMLANIDRYQT